MFLLAVLGRIQIFFFSFTAVAGGLLMVSLTVADIKGDAQQAQNQASVLPPR